METLKVKAEKREARGSRQTRKLRGEGRVPAVLYGRGKETVSLAVSTDDVRSILKAHSRTVTLAVSGKEEAALVQEVQTHPLDGEILHVDFARIALDEVVRVKVPVVLRGTPVGVATGGGVLEQQAHELEVECFPNRIPDQLVVKIDHLEIGKTVHAESVPLPEGVKLVAEAARAIATVHPPKVAVEETAAVAEVALQPEVIGAKEREERAKEKEKKEGGAPKEKEAAPEKKAEKK